MAAVALCDDVKYDGAQHDSVKKPHWNKDDVPAPAGLLVQSQDQENQKYQGHKPCVQSSVQNRHIQQEN